MSLPVCWSFLTRLFPVPIALMVWLAGCQPLQPQQSQTADTQSSDAVAAAAQPIKSGNSTAKLVYEGQQRTYRLYTPKAYRPDRPLPLVLAFHGYGSQGKDLANGSGFSVLAEQKGFLIAYPDGIERRWNPLDKQLTGVDDVGFVSALIDQLSQTRSIDPRRIYAAGVSNGGFLVQRLACEPSSRIAAFATVVASLPSQLQSTCHPPTPIPMLMINGTADRKVPWQGGNMPYGSLLSVPGTIDFWQRHDRCPASAPVKRLPNERIEIDRYSNCAGGSEVELIALKGVGHLWPRGGSGPTQLVNGSQEIWSFFERHTLRGKE